MNDRGRPWRPQADVPRYCDIALPPYRYLPGVTPHPKTDPRGHSRNGSLVAADPAVAFLQGVDLYNHGCWWEAHEAWEFVWMREKDARKDALQGLIQLANAHLKLELGKRNAVRRLKAEALALLRRAGEVRVDLPDLMARSDIYLTARLGQADLRHDLRGYPYLQLLGGQ